MIYITILYCLFHAQVENNGIYVGQSKITLLNVKAPVVATTNWWWLISALVAA